MTGKKIRRVITSIFTGAETSTDFAQGCCQDRNRHDQKWQHKVCVDTSMTSRTLSDLAKLQQCQRFHPEISTTQGAACFEVQQAATMKHIFLTNVTSTRASQLPLDIEDLDYNIVTTKMH